MERPCNNSEHRWYLSPFDVRLFLIWANRHVYIQCSMFNAQFIPTYYALTKHFCIKSVWFHLFVALQHRHIAIIVYQCCCVARKSMIIEKLLGSFIKSKTCPYTFCGDRVRIRGMSTHMHSHGLIAFKVLFIIPNSSSPRFFHVKIDRIERIIFSLCESIKQNN